MNILLINLDSELVQRDGRFSTGAYLRHIEYAKLLSDYFIIARTPRSDEFKIRNPIENLHIIPSLSLNKISFIYDAFCIGSQICKKNKIDLISCQDPFSTALAGYFLKKRFCIPLNIHILTDILDNPYFLAERRLNYFLNKWAKWIVKKADTVRVSTSKEKEKLISLGIDKEKIYCVPFFIDFTSFQQTDDNGIRQMNLNGRFNKIVLSVNRLAKQKNIEILIRAIPYVVKKYPKCLFLIVGSGPEEKNLKRLAYDLGVKEFIKFQGQVNHKDMPGYFQAADIFVSTSYYEGTCMAIQEAALAKKPIISTPHAGAYDAIVDRDTGFIIDFDDYIGLSKKILYLLENDKVAQDVGNKACSFISEYFRKEDILKKYYNLYEQTKLQ